MIAIFLAKVVFFITSLAKVTVVRFNRQELFMKSFITSRLSILLVLSLTACEVFKTTPRSSPDYRGPGSSNKNRTTYQKNTGNARANGRPASQNRSNNRPTGSSARSAANKPTSGSGRPSAPAAKKELAPRPAGAYTSNVPEVVNIARTYTGTPYRSGGNDKEGIDCSGLICRVYTEMGVKVPRISWQQSEFGREIEQIKDIRPGDWIFFVPEGGKEGYVSHSGIVTEVRGEQDILFIHASSSRGVVEDNLFSNYFRNRFVKAMRPF